MDPLYSSKRVQDPIQVISSLIGCSDRSDLISSLIARRDRKTSQEMGSGNSLFLLPDITSAKF